MTEQEIQNVAIRKEAEAWCALMVEDGARSEYFWKCLKDAAAARIPRATPHAKPSLVVDVVELLRGFNEPGLSLWLGFDGVSDVVRCTARIREERMAHSLQLSVIEQSMDPDAHVAELLRRLARVVLKGQGDTIDD